MLLTTKVWLIYLLQRLTHGMLGTALGAEERSIGFSSFVSNVSWIVVLFALIIRKMRTKCSTFQDTLEVFFVSS